MSLELLFLVVSLSKFWLVKSANVNYTCNGTASCSFGFSCNADDSCVINCLGEHSCSSFTHACYGNCTFICTGYRSCYRMNLYSYGDRTTIQCKGEYEPICFS